MQIGGHGGDKSNKKSTLGFIFLLESGAISCSNKKQLVVALLSTKAEYMGAIVASCEAV
jgi:hypothetical protein